MEQTGEMTLDELALVSAGAGDFEIRNSAHRRSQAETPAGAAGQDVKSLVLLSPGLYD